MRKINIPVGISDFEDIRSNGYYYVDKTGLITELLEGGPSEVTLITRPRRFGKTLAMSMLEYFFDIRKDSRDLFAGLQITGCEEMCRRWMNRWPVIFISFRQVDGLDFSGAYGMLAVVIAEVYKKHLYLMDSDKISVYDKKIMSRIMDGAASMQDLKNSLMLLTRVMKTYYGETVILLMDEYDVPMSKASSHGYYDEMLDMMKGITQALKDNQALCFAVVTGCLKIAKESIFTGTNNFVSDTITHSRLNEYFGFTKKEITDILEAADLSSCDQTIREWYDGYRFGDSDVYCPWDVMNYLRDIQSNPNARPQSYWKNTSDNSVIRSFIDYSGGTITKKLETLLSGEYIVQKIDENLTYDYLHSSEDNLWSVLYLTGYLTRMKESELPQSLPDGVQALRIPNAEIWDIFESTIMKWFDDSARTWNRSALFSAVWRGDDEAITQEMNRLLRKTISYHDYREDFYHAFLAGIFAGAGYGVESNREHGEGRSDVVVYDAAESRVAVLEAKYSRTAEGLEAACEEALRQIQDRMYAEDYKDEYDHIFCYGIAFYKKRCVVKMWNPRTEESRR